MAPEDNTCFVISPIGQDNSTTRKRSDDLLEYIIRPVVEGLGMIAQRADEIGHPGNITSQVVRKLVESKMVIADLTDRNPNVFYELAIRHVLNKPVVHMFSGDSELPFDIKIYRAIKYDTTDYAMIKPVMSKLKAQIQSQLKDTTKVSNPFSDAIPTISLEKSQVPEDEKIMSVIRLVESLGNQVGSLSNKVENLTGENISNQSRQGRTETRKDINKSFLLGRKGMTEERLRKLEHKMNLTTKERREITYLKRDLDQIEEDLRSIDNY